MLTTQRVLHPRPPESRRPASTRRSAWTDQDKKRVRQTAAYALVSGGIAVAMAQGAKPVLSAAGHPDSSLTFWLEVLVAAGVCVLAARYSDWVLARVARRGHR